MIFRYLAIPAIEPHQPTATQLSHRLPVVERSFALAKQWRALATRYDKLDITYCAAVVLSACITWTRI